MENRLSDILKESAVSLGLCKPWTEAWDDCNQQELIDKYKKGIDFCTDKGYPSPEFIDDNFDKELLQLNGIYCNDNEILHEDNIPMYIIRGGSSIKAVVRPFGVKTIHVCEDSVLYLKAKSLSKVFIRMHDNARLTVDADVASKVYVYIHSSNAVVSYDGRGQVLIKKGVKEEKK